MQSHDEGEAVVLTAMTMQPRRRSGRKRSSTKNNLRQVQLDGKLRQGPGVRSDRWCAAIEVGQEPELAKVVGSMNAWQQNTERVDIPVPRRGLRHVSSARMLRQVPAAEREPCYVPPAGKLHHITDARYRQAPTNNSASKGCQTPVEVCCQTPYAYKNGNTESSTVFPSFKGSHQFQGAPPVSRGSTSFKELHQRRNVVQDTFNNEEFNRVRETQVGDNQIVSKVAKFPPLNYNGAILPPGYGSLGISVNCQSTPVPVNSAATTSTVTVSTSTASVATKEWEHYKFWVPPSQVGQLDPSRYGSAVAQLSMSRKPITLSQCTRPSSTAHLEQLIPTAQTDTKVDDPNMIEDTSNIFVAEPNEKVTDKDDLVARQEEQNITEADKLHGYVPMVPMGLGDPNSVPPEEENDTEVSVGLHSTTSVTPEEGVNIVDVKTDCHAPIATITTGFSCGMGGCKYNTDFDAPADTDIRIKAQLLRIHAGLVHSIGWDDQDCVQPDMGVNAEVVHVDSDAPTMTKQKDQLHESFVGENADITAATIADLEDATGTTVPKGWTKSSSRSKKSKQLKKSRRLL